MMASGLAKWAKPLTLLAGVGLLLAIVTSPFAIARGGSRFGDIAQTAFFQTSFVITMFAAFLLILAFAALAARYGDAAGRIGMLGLCAAALGASLLFAAAWAIVAIVPAVARVAPSAVDPPPGPVFISFAGVGVLWLVFAFTLWLKRLFTLSTRVLVTLSALLSIGPLLPLGLLVMALAMLWISRREGVAGAPPTGV
jgi:hypothetical protein